MGTIQQRAGCVKPGGRFRLLLAVIICGVFDGNTCYAQLRESLAGESEAQALKKSIAAEQYNLHYGPVRMTISSGLGVSYTDNVFYSHKPSEDMLVRPEITAAGLWPVTELNTLRLSLGLSYEWYLKNRALNANAPLIAPGSELAFNLFVGDFRIRLHERISYQESLFFNGVTGDDVRFFNFNDVGTFSRLDNQAGFEVTWDLNQAVLSAGYNHENFISNTSSFEYLNRASEWFTASAALYLGDHAQTGLESQASVHNYDRETILNDNWRARVGPFVEVTLREKLNLRVGGGFDTARYDAIALGNNDYDSYYAYARIRQELRLFSHSLRAGRELLLGDNANNMKTTYVRYTISSPVVAHVDLGASASVNVAEEFGGVFEEKFTYYEAGVRVGYQFHKYWRADLSYEFRLKESDLAPRDFHRNQVTLAASYTF
ncbi:MAG: hypothetical protein JWR19_2938 [Pedosphaera sp.]|nr:hypothetical protein [Pedosphaera sp.]